MPSINKILDKKVKKFDVSVYEVDLTDGEQKKKLETRLVEKVKKIKAFKNIDQTVNAARTPGTTPEFIEKFRQGLVDTTNPPENPIKAFDIRRSYVTEFMSQILLEKHYQCFFYEEADRRMKADQVALQSHSRGIDVTGIQSENNDLKFVVCEVKASNGKIPTGVTPSLLEDVRNAKTLDNERLFREILSYLGDLNSNEAVFEKIIGFLTECLKQKDDKGFVLKNVIFFPFIIRKNEKIKSDSNVNDFTLFGDEDFNSVSIKGIIWSFNHDINDFCKNVWNEALNAIGN